MSRLAAFALFALAATAARAQPAGDAEWLAVPAAGLQPAEWADGLWVREGGAHLRGRPYAMTRASSAVTGPRAGDAAEWANVLSEVLHDGVADEFDDEGDRVEDGEPAALWYRARITAFDGERLEFEVKVSDAGGTLVALRGHASGGSPKRLRDALERFVERMSRRLKRL